jgi:hypothetical protein
MWGESRENVAQVERIFGVPIEVGSGCQPWCGYPADHGTIAQDGEIEAVAVKRYQLWGQLGDPVAECANQLLLGSLADVRRTERIDRSVIIVSVGDERFQAVSRTMGIDEVRRGRNRHHRSRANSPIQQHCDHDRSINHFRRDDHRNNLYRSIERRGSHATPEIRDPRAAQNPGPFLPFSVTS